MTPFLLRNSAFMPRPQYAILRSVGPSVCPPVYLSVPCTELNSRAFRATVTREHWLVSRAATGSSQNGNKSDEAINRQVAALSICHSRTAIGRGILFQRVILFIIFFFWFHAVGQGGKAVFDY